MKRWLLIPLVLLTLTVPTAASQPPVMVEDTFDNKLDKDWTWLRENSATWRIKDGALEIQVEPGKSRDVKNALLRTAPDRSKGNFAIEVTITFTADPTQQWEQAGIVWYHRKKPVLKLVHERIDGGLWIIPGRKPAPSKVVELRLVVRGVEWTAQYREDAEGEYLTADSGTLPPPGEDQISLQCYNGPSDSEHWIRFDNFRIVELQD